MQKPDSTLNLFSFEECATALESSNRATISKGNWLTVSLQTKLSPWSGSQTFLAACELPRSMQQVALRKSAWLPSLSVSKQLTKTARRPFIVRQTISRRDDSPYRENTNKLFHCRFELGRWEIPGKWDHYWCHQWSLVLVVRSLFCRTVGIWNHW